jgi:hypothetical protein
MFRWQPPDSSTRLEIFPDRSEVVLGERLGATVRLSGEPDPELREVEARLQYGFTSGEENGPEWLVAVARVPVDPGPTGLGERRVEFEVPAGAPPSCRRHVVWSCGLVGQRGRLAEGHVVQLTVRAPIERNAAAATSEPIRHPKGSGQMRLAIDLSERSVLAGEHVRGTLRVWLEGAAPTVVKKLEVSLVEAGRTPNGIRRQRAVVASKLALAPGSSHGFPFSLQVPHDADPTCYPVWRGALGGVKDGADGHRVGFQHLYRPERLGPLDQTGQHPVRRWFVRAWSPGIRHSQEEALELNVYNAPARAAAPTLPRPGWYADGSGWRWWDGAAWTEHTRSG